MEDDAEMSTIGGMEVNGVDAVGKTKNALGDGDVALLSTSVVSTDSTTGKKQNDSDQFKKKEKNLEGSKMKAKDSEATKKNEKESDESINKGKDDAVSKNDETDKSALKDVKVEPAPRKVIKFVDFCDDAMNEETSDDDVIIVAMVTKEDKARCVEVGTLDDGEHIRKADEDKPAPELSIKEKPDDECVQIASTSFESPKNKKDVLLMNIQEDHTAVIDMDVEDGDDEVTVGGQYSMVERKSKHARPLSIGPAVVNTERQTKEMEMCQKLGITTVTSSLDIFDHLKGRARRFPVAFDSFHAHIWSHFKTNGQDDSTFSWKMEVRDRLLAMTRTIFSDANIVAVGSTVNGCGAFNSDMDLCLCLPHTDYGYDTDRDFGIRALKKLWRVLTYRSNGVVRGCQFISAKVPILKLEMGNEFAELEIDINCNNIAGIYNSHLLHYYARIDDRFPALSLLVKHWAINAGINDAMSGTFNSYSLILMVVHFLQCATMPPVLPNLQHLHPDRFNGRCALDQLELFLSVPPLPVRPLNKCLIGDLLIAFFDYYAKFDFAHKAISVRKGCVFDRSDLAQTTRRFKVFIEEPFDQQNTARCVTRDDNLSLIKRALISARNAFVGVRAGEPSLSNIDVD